HHSMAGEHLPSPGFSPPGDFSGFPRGQGSLSFKNRRSHHSETESSEAQPLSLFSRGTSREDDFTVIGQFIGSYIIVERNEELLIIDQHNAHERINFDKLKQQHLQNQVVSISPLFPVVLELSASEKVRLDEARQELLQKLGFELRPLSGNAFDVKQFPQIIEERSVKEVILALLHLKQEEDIDFSDRVLSEIACKSSIKVNHQLYPEEMAQIVRDLFETSNPYFCPHKRPIIITFSLEEIEKKMKRK
ncbi:MAG: hypothetical protein KAT17_05795, partial [Candidatus Aminicenantes bacterium]|nr:hypothetical protein [Candidatus Aminicenantes bacterium]